MFSSAFPPRSLEEFGQDVLRVALGTAYALRPRRIAVLPAVTAAVLRGVFGAPAFPPFLQPDAPRPANVHGFVGLGGDLSPEELMAGFRRGYFPMGHIGRKKWWCPASRTVMAPHEMVREKDVRRLLRNKRMTVTFDCAFVETMLACADPRPGQVPLTWITRDIVAAYERLYQLGKAHSFEVWNADGELAGGGFGVAVGPVFVIESQFTRERNASKVGMVTLLRHLSAWGFRLVDGKSQTTHLERLGFRPIPYEDYVHELVAGPPDLGPEGHWTVDEALDASVDWQPAPVPMMSAARDARVELPVQDHTNAPIMKAS